MEEAPLLLSHKVMTNRGLIKSEKIEEMIVVGTQGTEIEIETEMINAKNALDMKIVVEMTERETIEVVEEMTMIDAMENDATEAPAIALPPENAGLTGLIVEVDVDEKKGGL